MHCMCVDEIALFGVIVLSFLYPATCSNLVGLDITVKCFLETCIFMWALNIL